MKYFITLILILFSNRILYAQSSGNINYPLTNQRNYQYTDQSINITTPLTLDVLADVKCMANVKADSYVAVFSVTQVGKTTQEVNELIDKRISLVLNGIKLITGTESYIDMVSFVPVYEIEADKKLFSKQNYNEIPKGFELKKNIHIKFTESELLNAIISIMANQDIYDLVRVDYFSSNIENIKKELLNKAKLILQDKIKNYESMIGATFTTNEKRIVDAYKIVLPMNMYRSYESYNSTSLNLKKSSVINTADKSTTLYYQPIMGDEFDYVMNPVILEPVIQVMYEIKVIVNRDKKLTTSDKEYMLITPSGEVKNLNLSK